MTYLFNISIAFVPLRPARIALGLTWLCPIYCRSGLLVRSLRNSVVMYYPPCSEENLQCLVVWSVASHSS